MTIYIYPKLQTSSCVDLAKLVVAHLVHQAVQQGGGAFPIHSELSRRSVIVVLFDLLALRGAAADTHHPHELVDICRKEIEKWPQSNYHQMSIQTVPQR